MKKKNFYQKFVLFLVSPKIFFYSSICLFLLVILGTIAQEKLGLYIAQQKYFSSFVSSIFFLPIPGAYLVLIIIFLNLFFKLIFKSSFLVKDLGILICHLGGLLLLFGGFITSFFSDEGYLLLKEGEKKDFYLNNHSVQLSIFNSDNVFICSFSEYQLKNGSFLLNKKIPFSFQILKFSRNISIFKRLNKNCYENLGLSKVFFFKAKQLEKETAKNNAGLVLSFFIDNKVRRFVIFQRVNTLQAITIRKYKYKFILEKVKKRIPFDVKLIKFKKKLHSLTNKSKSYKSFIFILDNQKKQNYLIQMNEPLRYRGYSFYQYSFIEDENSVVSILAVVRNNGYLIPYISSIVISFGLLWHLMVVLNKRKRL